MDIGGVSPDTEVVFRILGPVEAVTASGVRRFTARRQRAILGILLLRANRFVPAEELIDAIWHESPPSTARDQVQICVSRLRRELQQLVGAKLIVTRPGGYLCQVSEELVDAAFFEKHVALANADARSGRAMEAVVKLRKALALWRGPVLPDVAGKTRLLAESLEEKRISAVEHRIELELELGRHRELVSELVGLVVEYPLREQLRASLMIALRRSGRQAEALEVYRQARRELITELGIEPGDRLQQLESSILSGSAELDELLPAASGAGPVPIPRQLPADIGDFTGQGPAVSAAQEALGAEPKANAMRIVRISGRGGIGKTALAVHVAHRLRDHYPDGQLFACLHGPSSSSQVVEILVRFLRAVGVRAPDIPRDLDELQDVYRSRLSDRRMLIVLDDAASEEQLAPLLPGSRSCSVIVTSRRPLGNLPGALHLNLDVLDNSHAKQLLAKLVGEERATADPDALQALVQLCGRWPLAIRIIGARLAARPHWSLSFMVDRLRHKQRRLDEIAYGNLHVRATLAISYEGLSDGARRLFRLLGLCGETEFAAWTAAALLDTDCVHAEDLLDELVEVRLLDVVDSLSRRYGCHDLVRIFAQERLAAQDSAATWEAALRRLLSARLALAREAHRRLYGGEVTVPHGSGGPWRLSDIDTRRVLAHPMRWVEAEGTGLMAAVHQAADIGADELCWDLALTSVTLFEARGQVHYWSETHDRALQVVRDKGNTRGEAAILCSLGALRQLIHGESGTDVLDEALRLFTELGDRHGQALTLRNLAHADRMTGRLDRALERYGAAIDGFRAAGDPVAEAHALVDLAEVHADLLRFDEAETALDDAMTLCRGTGNQRVEAQTWQRLGEMYLRQLSLDEAERAFQHVLEIVQPMDDRVGEAFALCGLGTSLTHQGNFVDAEKALSRALEISEAAGAHLAEGRALLALGWLHMARDELDSAEERLHRASSIFEGLRVTLWQARAQESLAEVRGLRRAE